MLLDNKPYTIDRIARIAIGVMLALGLLWLLRALSDVLIPFASALLLAYLINPLVVLYQRRIKNRALAVSLALATVAVVVITALVIIVPMVGRELAATGKLVAALVSDSEVAARTRELLPKDTWVAVKEALSSDQVQEWLGADSLMKLGGVIGRKVLPGVWGVVAGTFSVVAGVIGLVVVVLYLIFLLMDFQKVRTAWKELIPPAYRDSVTGFVSDFDEGMNRYFRGQAIVAATVGILFAAGFTLIGLPMGMLLGLLIGLLNMVPYLQILGFIPALFLGAVHSLESGDSVVVGLLVVCLVFAVVQSIQDLVLVPRIMGKATGLSPWMILLSLSVWGKLFGFFGLLIALPMTCLLLAYYRRFLVAGALSKGLNGPQG